jgi:hypothetical protein
MSYPAHTCEPTEDGPCAGCDAVRADLASMARDLQERLGRPFARPELGDRLLGAPIVVVDDTPIWDRDWSTPTTARAAFAAAMECDPSDLRVEGPDGGPYVISFDPAAA